MKLFYTNKGAEPRLEANGLEVHYTADGFMVLPASVSDPFPIAQAMGLEDFVVTRSSAGWGQNSVVLYAEGDLISNSLKAKADQITGIVDKQYKSMQQYLACETLSRWTESYNKERKERRIMLWSQILESKEIGTYALVAEMKIQANERLTWNFDNSVYVEFRAKGAKEAKIVARMSAGDIFYSGKVQRISIANTFSGIPYYLVSRLLEHAKFTVTEMNTIGAKLFKPETLEKARAYEEARMIEELAR